MFVAGEEEEEDVDVCVCNVVLYHGRKRGRRQVDQELCAAVVVTHQGDFGVLAEFWIIGIGGREEDWIELV